MDVVTNEVEESTSSLMTINNLPVEMLSLILEHIALNRKTMRACSLVSKAWREVVLRVSPIFVIPLLSRQFRNDDIISSFVRSAESRDLVAFCHRSCAFVQVAFYHLYSNCSLSWDADATLSRNFVSKLLLPYTLSFVHFLLMRCSSEHLKCGEACLRIFKTSRLNLCWFHSILP